MNIGKVIKKERVKRKISREMLSNRCKISRSCIYYIEAGRTSPSIDTLEKIASVLHLHVWELVKKGEEKNVENKNDGRNEYSVCTESSTCPAVLLRVLLKQCSIRCPEMPDRTYIKNEN